MMHPADEAEAMSWGCSAIILGYIFVFVVGCIVGHFFWGREF